MNHAVEEAPEGEPDEEMLLREMLAQWGASEEEIRKVVEGLKSRARETAPPAPHGPERVAVPEAPPRRRRLRPLRLGLRPPERKLDRAVGQLLSLFNLENPLCIKNLTAHLHLIRLGRLLH
jgi:hypothetical protein